MQLTTHSRTTIKSNPSTLACSETGGDTARSSGLSAANTFINAPISGASHDLRISTDLTPLS